MSSSPIPPSADQPLYTQEILYNIEAELVNDGQYITLQNSSGKTARSMNTNQGEDIGARYLRRGTRSIRNVVAFQDERDLRRLELQGKADMFFPVYNTSMAFSGPNHTEEETRDTFTRILQEFEESEEAAAIAELVKTHLRGRAVNKVIAFGLGRIGFLIPGSSQSFYEHAAARVIANAVGEVSPSTSIALVVQDPLYTDVCKSVLGEFDFDVIEGFGAKGFALIDEHTVVLAHHPSFPLREIIADLGRPALICMKAQESMAEWVVVPALPDLRADVDSVRSRRMLQEYQSVALKVSGKQRAFWDNTWYVRNHDADPEQVS
ncbi:hypothetical protein F5Y12DRAFT_784031 [Xylaria sp. FL1777]|nr:hypothetical protein F5Y12DRAFT_784031 [Xylaria sp. FL1777]